MKQVIAIHPDCESFTSIASSLLQWVRKCRDAFEARNQLANCGPNEIAQMTRDLRLQPAELAGLIKQGPDAADLLQELLPAVGLDAKRLALEDPTTMRDLQRLCSFCADKRRCQLDLANGKSADNFRDYCPNAFTIDALLQANQ